MKTVLRQSVPRAAVPGLQRVFTWYEEASITDAQVERILAPVLAFIRSGAYDPARPPACKRHNLLYWRGSTKQ